MTDGDGVWHVVDDQTTKLISYALNRGAEPAQEFSTYEVPGHYACMLYAAIACPFLAFPNARRTVDGVGGLGNEAEVAVGTRRGALSGLAEFASCAVEIMPGGYVVVLQRPRSIHPYRTGADLLPLLQDAVDKAPAPPQPQSEWFGSDERIVIRELLRATNENTHRREYRQPFSS